MYTFMVKYKKQSVYFYSFLLRRENHHDGYR